MDSESITEALSFLISLDALSKVRQNWSPSSEAERQRVAEIVSSARRCLSSLDSAAPENALSSDDLTVQHEALQNQLSICSSLLAPIRLLPPELLSHIFLLMQPEGICVLKANDSQVLAISQTCAYWRSEALSTTDLWRRISVDIDSTHRLDHETALNLTRVASARSANAPLWLSFRCFRTPLVRSDRLFIKVLATKAERWERVELLGLSLLEMDTILAPLRECFHALTHLRLSLPMETATSEFTAFEKALQLTDVRIAHPPGRQPRFKLPWKRIRTTALPSCPSASNSEILKACSQLDRLIIFGDEGFCSTTHDKLITSHAHSVEIKDVLPYEAREVFSHYAFPRLSSLTIRGIHRWSAPWFPMTTFKEFLAHSGSGILFLHLEKVSLGPGSTAPLFREMINLQHLRLGHGESDEFTENSPVSASLMDVLHSRNGLLPRLLWVDLDGPSGMVELFDKKFLDMVQSRRGCGACAILERVSLGLDRDFTLNLMPEVHALKRTGLLLTISGCEDRVPIH